MARLNELVGRRLMGPGPSNVPPRVLEALARPTIGHLDPQLLDLLGDIREMLQQLFRTRNDLTLAVSGTGSAGMEACTANLIEPGDRVLVCVAGLFGRRLADAAGRAGAKVRTVTCDYGQAIEPEQVAEAFEEHGPFKLVGIVHAETSTGVAQPIEPVSRIAHDAGALLLVDAVTSLGGMEVNVDGWQIDACYSATQKCLSCPPGLSPVTLSPAAEDVIAHRETPVRSWYLDLGMVRRYWGSERFYHHTAPVNMLYALHEALRIVLGEGLSERFDRHKRAADALRERLAKLGLRTMGDTRCLLPMLTPVAPPEGRSERAIRDALLDEHNIEIGGGLGDWAGTCWRVGLMGEGATVENVDALIAALREILAGE